MKRALVLLAIVESCQAAQIYFTGVCGDCEGNTSATLTVTGFDPANPFTLTLSKFVSFSYAGTDLVPPFVIDSTNVTNVLGSPRPHVSPCLRCPHRRDAGNSVLRFLCRRSMGAFIRTGSR
jgi:hypothetical protein